MSYRDKTTVQHDLVSHCNYCHKQPKDSCSGSQSLGQCHQQDIDSGSQACVTVSLIQRDKRHRNHDECLRMLGSDDDDDPPGDDFAVVLCNELMSLMCHQRRLTGELRQIEFPEHVQVFLTLQERDTINPNPNNPTPPY